MHDFKPDHLIIGIRTHDHDGWQERHLIENVRHPVGYFPERFT